jgi:hypothetical protein
VGHVAHVREMRNAYRICVGKLKDMRPLERLTISGRIILKFKKR